MLSALYRTPAAVALAAAVALSSACGSDNAVRGDSTIPVPEGLECFDGNISASGSSAQENAMQTWIAGYQRACEKGDIYYDAIGSGGGRNQFVDGAVDFAGSDAPLDSEEHRFAAERCNGSEAINLPAYVIPIAVVVNVAGVDSLNLRPETIARIFNGEITNWNDPAIAETNPDVDLPDRRITPVTRSDESGTTENFTAYLDAAAGDAWPHEPDGQWPTPPAEAAQGNSGVAEAVKGGDGMIGYVEASHAEAMSTVRVGVGDEFVEMTPEAAAEVVAASPEREENSEYDLALELDYRITDAATYPIVLITYEITCLEYDDPDTAERVKTFLNYLVSEEGQQAASDETGSAPLSDDLRGRVQESIDAVHGPK
ncbi:phosphate transport system substrate-binding protein [Lipingzhangella halophila]|uniref:Phosphate-binding protein n=1 Tax=Lipingzhangella halophila TaxID=1783352 RepID=A0A7W7W2K8_9ACTN|nr:phosphate ABC transporter substrate-binding protein PstS [Lipingzhangella halophila]MBB4931558.1 phosphate transport system substrate-binding protein [Lipingzhangella halophila]